MQPVFTPIPDHKLDEAHPRSPSVGNAVDWTVMARLCREEMPKGDPYEYGRTNRIAVMPAQVLESHIDAVAVEHHRVLVRLGWITRVEMRVDATRHKLAGVASPGRSTREIDFLVAEYHAFVKAHESRQCRAEEHRARVDGSWVSGRWSRSREIAKIADGVRQHDPVVLSHCRVVNVVGSFPRSLREGTLDKHRIELDVVIKQQNPRATCLTNAVVPVRSDPPGRTRHVPRIREARPKELCCRLSVPIVRDEDLVHRVRLPQDGVDGALKQRRSIVGDNDGADGAASRPRASRVVHDAAP
jgi:hypothetical protein